MRCHGKRVAAAAAGPGTLLPSSRQPETLRWNMAAGVGGFAWRMVLHIRTLRENPFSEGANTPAANVIAKYCIFIGLRLVTSFFYFFFFWFGVVAAEWCEGCE